VPKIRYRSIDFQRATLDVIEQAEAICRQYAAAGDDLTLRQLYYQFVARGLLANTQKNYKRLQSIVSDARLAGLIDWYHIVDRTRNLSSPWADDSPASAIELAANGYRLNRWVGQPTYMEVWVEKDALSGIVSRAADAYDVPWFACRGNVSQSEMWSAGRRLIDQCTEHDRSKILILHLGDHDPNGIDMTRDITDRLTEFMEDDAELLEVRRIALNIDQVRALNPPPNPVKLTDSRAAGYISRFGSECWELDALDPPTLRGLITREIEAEVNMGIRRDVLDQEERERELLTAASDRWPELVDILEGSNG
jgi:hypothetical protein